MTPEPPLGSSSCRPTSEASTRQTSTTWSRGGQTIPSASSLRCELSLARRAVTARRCSISRSARPPGWRGIHRQRGFEFLRSTILVTRWDYKTLERALGDLCLHTTGDDWREIATRLSRYGRWEFEDYRG
ncbi:MAG TPA: Imm8 family immunity protein [Gaiellaceae bacterium]|nr:Imm8 family immunity protein [Gaiellaceae bacterium]